MTTPTTPKVQIITADRVPDLLEQILALRNPKLRAQRRAGHKKQRDRIRNWKGVKIIGAEHLDPLDKMMISMALRNTGKPTPPIPGSGLIARLNNTDMLFDLNRDLNERRVAKYLKARADGKWVLTPDAIAISPEGLVINGQHRLAAAHRFVTQYTDIADHEMPRFIVAWGIDRSAALFMDEASRSTHDRRTIALRYAELSN